jgi:hypothetical protein
VVFSWASNHARGIRVPAATGGACVCIIASDPQRLQHGAGVDIGTTHNSGQCDDGEFKLVTAAVAAEAAVERKEARRLLRRVRPVLSAE